MPFILGDSISWAGAVIPSGISERVTGLEVEVEGILLLLGVDG